jgi:WD40 repeat protein
LWDPTSVPQTRVTLLAGADRVVAVLAASGAPLAVVCSGGRTGLFNPVSGEALDHVDGKGPVTCATLSDNGHYLALGCLDGSVNVWDLRDLQRPPRKQELGNRINALAAGTGPRGVGLIVGGDREGSVTAWNAANGRQAWQHPAARAGSPSLSGSAHRGEVTAVAVAGPAGYALTGGRDRLANVWDLRTGERRHHIPCGGPVTALTSSTDGQYAGVATSQGELIVGRVRIAEGLSSLRGHEAPVSAAVALGDGFVTAAGKNVRLWSVADGQVVREWANAAEVLSLALADGDVLAGLADGSARRLSPRLPRPTWVFQRDGAPATAVAAGGHNTVVAGWGDGVIRAWRHGSTPPVIRTKAKVEGLLVVSGGMKAISTHGNRSAYLWDLSSDVPVAEFRDFFMTVAALGANADGTLAAIGCRDGSVLIADTRDGGVATSIERQPGSLLTCLAFVGAGEHLAVGYDDGSSRLWNVATSAWSPERLVHPGPVSAITPLGAQHFLTGSEDGSVGLWRLPGPEHAVELRAHLLVAAPVTCVAAGRLTEPVLVGTTSGDVICVSCC